MSGVLDLRGGVRSAGQAAPGGPQKPGPLADVEKEKDEKERRSESMDLADLDSKAMTAALSGGKKDDTTSAVEEGNKIQKSQLETLQEIAKKGGGVVTTFLDEGIGVEEEPGHLDLNQA